MRIKSYFAASVQQAIERARQELGPDAMLMNSRKTDPELKHLGAFEVVFGLANESGTTAKPASELAPAAPEAGQVQDLLVKEIAELRRQIETVKRSVSRQNLLQSSALNRKAPEIQDLHSRLVAADFSEEVAHEVVQGVQARLLRQEAGLHTAEPRPSSLNAALSQELESRFHVAPGILGSNGERKTLIFVGPPGAGKTTSLTKIAMKYGLASQIPLQILSTDTMRVGGSEQLGAYARILGVGFQAVHSVAGLDQALEEYRAKKLILIDTPGYDSGSMDEAEKFASFLFGERNLDVHLVMPALLRPAAAMRIYERFAIFKPSKLLFTHIDDTEIPGGALDLAFRTGLPLSYLSNGQGIPEHLEEASKLRLTEKLFECMQSAALSAA